DDLTTCNGIPESCLSNPGPECLPPDSGLPAVVATPGDSSVRLSWSPLADADAYRVERWSASSGTWAVIGRTASSSFVDDTVTNDVEFRYRVVALRNGFAGEPSTAVPVVPQSAPGGPSDFAVTSGDRSAALSWTPGPGTSSTHVLRAPAATGPFSEIAVVSATSYTDTGLQNGTTYWYALSATNPVGESTRTAALRAIPIAAPTGLAAVPSDGQVALFWSPSVGATSFDVQRANDASGPWSSVGQSTSPRFSDGGLSNGTTLFYRVLASNAAGTSAPTAAVAATPGSGVAVQPPTEDPTRNKVGLNVWFNRDWGGQFAFVDVMKESRAWQDAANWNLPVGGVDEFGWPTADASTVVFSGDAADFNGTYTLLFEGQADVSLMWTAGTVANKTWDAATNTTRAEVTYAMTPSNRSVGLVFRNTRRTPSSPLGSGFRNARLYRPGYPTDGSVVFTTPFLEALGKAGTVRMMEWAGGSSDLVQHWSERSTPLHATQGGLPAPLYTGPDGQSFQVPLGVALEHRIQLCNRLMVDCWINVPPAADDEYVQNLALALRFGTDGRNPYTSPQASPVFPPLHPSLRIYLEYSNENWNSGSGFLAFQVIKGICAHLDASHPVMVPTPDGIYSAMWRYPAWRTWGIGEIFRTVFGDAAMLSRIRPVLMTQRGNAQGTLSTALLWLDEFLQRRAVPRRISDVLWGAGGSGYWGATNMVSAVPDQFFASGNIPDATSLRDFSTDSVWTGNYGLRQIAYEGGPGLSFSGADNRTLNADPRMKDAVEAVHDAWSAVGGDLLVYYTLRGPTEWEFTPAIANAATPKLLALDALQARPRGPVTIGAALPGRIVVKDSASVRIRTGYGYNLTIDGLSCEAGFQAGQMIAAAGHADTAFSGALKVTAYSSSQTRLAVWVNGVRQGEITVPALAGNLHLYDSTSVSVSVPAGRVVVRLEILEGSLGAIYSIDL
ncbi:MAG: fibronectin type III domain-containing protein, partial [Alphaproteobacteria bacterium]